MKSLSFANHSINTLVCIVLETFELLFRHFMIQMRCLIEQVPQFMFLYLLFRHVNANIFEIIFLLVISSIDLVDLTYVALVPGLQLVKLVRKRLKLVQCGVATMKSRFS